MKFFKRLFKRLLLKKWVFSIVWRVVRKRTVYPLHDVPYTVLRFTRSAIHCTLKDVETKQNRNKQKIYDMCNITLHVINEELNIRKMRMQRLYNQQ